jgi:hypothetical protein
VTVVLQNKGDSISSKLKKGMPFLFLGEDYCFFTNESGIVRDRGEKKYLKIGHNSSILTAYLYPFLLVPMAHSIGRASHSCLYGFNVSTMSY